MHLNRVVITGAGGVSPRGNDLGSLLGEAHHNQLVENTIKGTLGLTEITEFAHDQLGIHVLGLVRGVEPEHIKRAAGKNGRRGIRWWNRTAKLSAACAYAALKEAGLLDDANVLTMDPERIAAHTACDVEDLPYDKLQTVSLRRMLGLFQDSDFCARFFEVLPGLSESNSASGDAPIEFLRSAMSEQGFINGMVDGMDSRDWFLSAVAICSTMAINMSYGFEGPFVNTTTACAASLCALESAFDHIRLGKLDAALSGGMWTRLAPNSLAGLLSFQAIISPNNCQERPPGETVRPFDLSRDGIIPAEGGAYFVLESLEHAQKRGAKILAEISGFGASTAPDCLVEPNQRGFVRAIRAALKAAKLSPNQIQHINAHATGTMAGDIVEAMSIREAFGDATDKIPVSALKGGTGHQILGSGATAVHASLRTCIELGIAYPNVNLTHPDPRCELVLPTEAVELRPNERKHVAVLAAGFGGEARVAILSDFVG